MILALYRRITSSRSRIACTVFSFLFPLTVLAPSDGPEMSRRASERASPPGRDANLIFADRRKASAVGRDESVRDVRWACPIE